MSGARQNRNAKAPANSGVRPEEFLFTPWRGHGLVCDAFGLPSDRYENAGRGRRESDGSTVIEHSAHFESGIVNDFEWRFEPNTGEAIAARDLKTGAELRGALTPYGFRWSFPATFKTPLGIRRCRVEVDYRLKSPTEATSSVTITFLGVTVGTGSAHLRHVGPHEDGAS
jgi:hypothetical protein